MKHIEIEFINDSVDNAFNVEQMRCHYFPRPLHMHTESELTYIKEGTGLCFAGDGITLMQPKHLYFFSSNLSHYFQSDKKYYIENCDEFCHSIYIQFKNNILPRDFETMPGCSYIQRLLTLGNYGLEWDISQNEELCNDLEKMLEISGFERLQKLYWILDKLGQISDKAMTISSDDYATNLQSDDQIYNKIIEYISLHFQEDVTLDEIAEFVGMNSSALCRYFKRKTECSVFEYLLRFRIKYTKKQLLYTDLPVSHIAYDSGFNNLAGFNLQFKRQTGYTPTQYRKMFKDQSPV